MQQGPGVSSDGDFPTWVNDPASIPITNICAGINIKTPFDTFPVRCNVSDTSIMVRFVPQSTQTFCPTRQGPGYPYARVILGSDGYGVGADVFVIPTELSLYAARLSSGAAGTGFTVKVPETPIGIAEYQDAKTACPLLHRPCRRPGANFRHFEHRFAPSTDEGDPFGDLCQRPYGA